MTFKVDIGSRTVSHSSGAAARFYRYCTMDAWRASDSATLHNPDLYPGSASEFGRLAKEAALTAGMDHGGPPDEGGNGEISLLDCRIDWDAGAALQELVPSTRGAAWVGEQVFDGTVGGAIRLFKSLPLERRHRIEMFIDAGKIEACEQTILGFDELNVIASRSDVPGSV